MNLYELRQDNFLVLQPAGRLDSSNCQEFEREVKGRIESGDTRIVIDFKELDYISSAGLRVLLMSAKLVQSKDGSLSLCALNDNIKEVFEISGFSSIFQIYGSLEEAVSGA